MGEKYTNTDIQFASSYIQTLHYAKSREEFETENDYQKYLDDRKSAYYLEYLKAIIYSCDQRAIGENQLKEK